MGGWWYIFPLHFNPSIKPSPDWTSSRGTRHWNKSFKVGKRLKINAIPWTSDRRGFFFASVVEMSVCVFSKMRSDAWNIAVCLQPNFCPQSKGSVQGWTHAVSHETISPYGRYLTVSVMQHTLLLEINQLYVNFNITEFTPEMIW